MQKQKEGIAKTDTSKFISGVKTAPEWVFRGKDVNKKRNENELAYPDAEITEYDVSRVVDLLEEEKNLRMTEEQKTTLEHAKKPIFDNYFSIWTEPPEEINTDNEDEIVKDFDQSHRLTKLWKERPRWVSWTFSLSFHLVVILNFLYCVWESFGVLAENAKFDYLYLKDVYQCLGLVPNRDATAIFVDMIHAFTAVTALHAKTLRSANLCWTFIFGTVLHSCVLLFSYLFDEWFNAKPFQDNIKAVNLCFFLLLELITIIVVLQRYYDLTSLIEKRDQKFVTQTYEGRQLNDRIIYRNVSSFIQRKYVQRSCTALQIYNTIQHLQQEKKKLRKGEELDEKYFQLVVQDAVQALKDVEGYHGMDMMRELKRRNYEHLKSEFEVGEETEEIDEELQALGEIEVLNPEALKEEDKEEYSYLGQNLAANIT